MMVPSWSIVAVVVCRSATRATSSRLTSKSPTSGALSGGTQDFSSCGRCPPPAGLSKAPKKSSRASGDGSSRSNSRTSPWSSARIRMSSIRSPPPATSSSRASSFSFSEKPRSRFAKRSCASTTSSNRTARAASTTSGNPAWAVTSSPLPCRITNGRIPCRGSRCCLGLTRPSRRSLPPLALALPFANLAPQLRDLARRQLVDDRPESVVGGHGLLGPLLVLGPKVEPSRAPVQEYGEERAGVKGLGVLRARATAPATPAPSLVDGAAHQRLATQRAQPLVEIAAPPLDLVAFGGHTGSCTTYQNMSQEKTCLAGEFFLAGTGLVPPAKVGPCRAFSPPPARARQPLERSYGLIPVAEASLIAVLESVLGPVWVWLVVGERPGVFSLAGGAVILSALVAHTAADLARPAVREGAD